MKRTIKPKRKPESLLEQHARLFVPFSFTPVSDLYDLRQPDFVR